MKKFRIKKFKVPYEGSGWYLLVENYWGDLPLIIVRSYYQELKAFYKVDIQDSIIRYEYNEWERLIQEKLRAHLEKYENVRT